jgi:hypothetical protein
MKIRNEFHVGRPNDDDDDDDDEKETKGHCKGKKAKRYVYHCPASCFTLSP